MNVNNVSLFSNLTNPKQANKKPSISDIFQTIVTKAENAFETASIKKYSIPQTIAAKPTSNIALGVNLSANTQSYAQPYDAFDPSQNMSNGAVQPSFSRAVSVYDSLGVAHDVKLNFLKTEPNTWRVEVSSDANETVNGSNLIAAGKITFNNDGTLNSVDSSLTKIQPISWSNGSVTAALNINYGKAGIEGEGNAAGMSQFASNYAVKFVNSDGTSGGKLDSVKPNANGGVTANYNDGQQVSYAAPTKPVGSNFANVDFKQINDTVNNALKLMQSLKAYGKA